MFRIGNAEIIVDRRLASGRFLGQSVPGAWERFPRPTFVTGCLHSIALPGWVAHVPLELAA